MKRETLPNEGGVRRDKNRQKKGEREEWEREKRTGEVGCDTLRLIADRKNIRHSKRIRGI